MNKSRKPRLERRRKVIKEKKKESLPSLYAV
jgi:hypothetical protein